MTWVALEPSDGNLDPPDVGDGISGTDRYDRAVLKELSFEVVPSISSSINGPGRR